MPRRARAALAVGCAALAAALAANGPSSGGARLRVGPDLLVSRDGDHPHVELHLAADPREPGHLLGGAISLDPFAGRCRPYLSHDGGWTWSSPDLPGQLGDCADPQAAFTPRGTALFVELPSGEAGGETVAPLNVWRSTDGGLTWAAPLDLGQFFDHPLLAVDATGGPRDGTVYVAAMGGRDYALSLFRSTDDGRSFAGPFRFAASAEGSGRGLNVGTPLPLADGTLVLPYFDFPLERAEERGASRLWAVVSRDGGGTVGPPAAVGEMVQARPGPDFASRLATFPAFAAGGERLYAAWTDYRAGAPRVLLAVSADRGASWSAARPLAPAPPGAAQFQPALAVDAEGTLAALWLDTRDGPAGSAYHAYAVVSRDGGASFLPPVRLSSVPSLPLGRGNTAFTSAAWRDRRGAQRVSLLTAAGRFQQGGDYIGLAAAAPGLFHAFWPDARSGTFQVWTARFWVEEGGDAARAVAAAPVVDVTADVDVLLDPPSVDEARRELALPVRLRNRSARPIGPPLVVELKGFGSGPGTLHRENAPAVLNADNGEPGAGATFDYSAALADLPALAPGAVTRAVVWRFRLPASPLLPDLHLAVRGAAATPPAAPPAGPPR